MRLSLKTVSLSIRQLKILLEATNYFLDGLEDDTVDRKSTRLNSSH